MIRSASIHPSAHSSASPRAVALAVLLAFACGQAAAQEGKERDEPLVSDRPDFVEASEVVGKGRVQLETGLLSERARGDDGEGRERTLSTPTLLRIGIHDALELRIESEGRTVRHIRDAETGGRRTLAGYADTSVGLSWHLADASGSLPSIGALVDAELPTGSQRLRGEGVRPMLRLVGEWDLAGGVQLGVMPGIAVEREGKDGHGEGRYSYGLFGVAVEKRLGERLSGFAELALPQIASGRHGGTQASAGIGLAYLLSNDCQVDTMFSRGLNHRTPYASFTVGLSIRR